MCHIRSPAVSEQAGVGESLIDWAPVGCNFNLVVRMSPGGGGGGGGFSWKDAEGRSSLKRC